MSELHHSPSLPLNADRSFAPSPSPSAPNPAAAATTATTMQPVPVQQAHDHGGFSPRAAENDDSGDEQQQQHANTNDQNNNNDDDDNASNIVPSPLDLDKLADSRIQLPFSAMPDDKPPPIPTNIANEHWQFGDNLIISYVTWNMAGKEDVPASRIPELLTPIGHIHVFATQENGPYVGTNAVHEGWERTIIEGLNKNERKRQLDFLASAANNNSNSNVNQQQQRSAPTPPSGSGQLGQQNQQQQQQQSFRFIGNNTAAPLSRDNSSVGNNSSSGGADSLLARGTFGSSAGLQQGGGSNATVDHEQQQQHPNPRFSRSNTMHGSVSADESNLPLGGGTVVPVDDTAMPHAVLDDPVDETLHNSSNNRHQPQLAVFATTKTMDGSAINAFVTSQDDDEDGNNNENDGGNNNNTTATMTTSIIAGADTSVRSAPSDVGTAVFASSTPLPSQQQQQQQRRVSIGVAPAVSRQQQQPQQQQQPTRTHHQFTYVKVKSCTMMACHLLVLVRSDVAQYVGRVHCAVVKTGAMGLGNKGGLCVEMNIVFPDRIEQLQQDHHDQQQQQRRRSNQSLGSNSTTRNMIGGVSNSDGIRIRATANNRPVRGISFAFICAHLAPHEHATKERNENFFTILRDLAVGSRGPFRSEARPTPGNVEIRNVGDEFDFLIFGGDLNYRIDGNKEAVEHIIHKHGNLRAVLSHNDQLLKQLRTSKQLLSIFRGFREGPLVFRPTYKYRIDGKDDGNKKPTEQAGAAAAAASVASPNAPEFSGYDRGPKNRLPSYTDRVLYRRHHTYRYPLHLLYYHDCRDVTVSDHKPVLAVMALGTPFEAEVVKHVQVRKMYPTPANGAADDDDIDGAFAAGGCCGC